MEGIGNYWGLYSGTIGDIEGIMQKNMEATIGFRVCVSTIEACVGTTVMIHSFIPFSLAVSIF